MSLLYQLFKLFLLNIIILFFVFCINVNITYAVNNNLAAETFVLTPYGNIPIEKLHSGDLIVGYNFETNQQEIHHIKDLKKISVLSYYLINDQAKITGSDLIYVKNNNNFLIKRVHQLKNTDNLLDLNTKDYFVESIEQIIKPSTFYQISLEEKNSNLFTDPFLIYSGDNIPIKFQKDYQNLDCGVGAPYINYRSSECMKIYSAFPGFVIALVLLLVGLILGTRILDFLRHIYSNLSQ